MWSINVIMLNDKQNAKFNYFQWTFCILRYQLSPTLLIRPFKIFDRIIDKKFGLVPTQLNTSQKMDHQGVAWIETIFVISLSSTKKMKIMILVSFIITKIKYTWVGTDNIFRFCYINVLYHHRIKISNSAYVRAILIYF